MRNLALVCLSLVLIACTTPSTVAPLSISLQYKTMADPGDFSALPPCAAVSRVDVVDKRSEPALGKRFVEGNNAATAAVTTTSDVRAWVRSGVEGVLKRSGVALGTAGAPILRVTVERIATTENVVHRSGYEAKVALAGELRSGKTEAACWQNRSEGASENYGYSGSAENYQETLNHALDRAAIRLLASPEIRDAVCKCGS